MVIFPLQQVAVAAPRIVQDTHEQRRLCRVMIAFCSFRRYSRLSENVFAEMGRVDYFVVQRYH